MLLERSLTHKSYANENKVPSHNERMEFLGDSVLNLIVSEYLMNACPDSSEGDLSRLRAAVVSEPALAMVAREIGLGSYILLGRGEEQTGGRDKDSLLADSLEALIASIYLDAGKEEAEAFILRFFEEGIKNTCASGGSFDYKTRLQELCQETAEAASRLPHRCPRPALTTRSSSKWRSGSRAGSPAAASAGAKRKRSSVPRKKRFTGL